MSGKSVIVVGAGGHAKVVVATLREAGFTVAGLFDDDARKLGQRVLDVPVRGVLADLVALKPANLVIAIGNNVVRRQIAGRLGKSNWVTVIHPRACVHKSAKLGPGTVVFAGAVIQPDAQLGAHCIVNTAATIDHDCRLGDFVHVAPGGHLGGNVTVGDGVLLGIGSGAIPGVQIGEWTTVGAGGVVTRDLPSGCVAVGVPAKART
jgi:sugar O-acyltransferase (sialic acid O-acetyltransferase NeuD family)